MHFLRTKYAEFAKVLIILGVIFITIGIVLLFLVFKPALSEEVKYATQRLSNLPVPQITPLNENFSVVIPKLNANAQVIPNVDPFNESIYQQALSKGVAHAKGTALPNEKGTVFLFAHSAQDFYIANKYNAVFYLLYKLEKGDKITLYFDKEKIEYSVKELRYTTETDIDYLTKQADNNRLILMTCWPPGTTLQRLLVIAEPIN